MRHAHRGRRRILTAALAAGLLLGGASGCGQQGGGPETTDGPLSSLLATPTGQAQETTPACGELDAAQAAERWIDEVPPVPTLADREWTVADRGGYDPCAELSWIAVTLAGGTVSTPYHIMLFHRGEYLGTATETAYGFSPGIERIGDGAIRVSYRWPRDGEANAAASGRSIATFTWNAQSGEVDFSGELPPE